MKRHLINLTAILKENITKLANSTYKYNLATKLLSLFLITALMMPLVFFGSWNGVAAQINRQSSPDKQASAPISAPPLLYKFSDSSSGILDSALNSQAALAISDSVSTISDFVTPQKMPQGFELAQKPSPAYLFASSVFSPVSSFFDSIINFFSSTSSSTTNPTALLVASSVEFDYDGDNKADLSLWQPSIGKWKIKNSGTGNYTNYPSSSTIASNVKIAPGDFKGGTTTFGDGTTDIAYFDAGTWTINPSNGSQYTVSFGAAGDKPVVGDYDGDGTSDLAVFRSSTNTWWIQKSSNSTIISIAFGASGDITVPGDYDGDGKTDAAVFRPSNGYWYVLNSSNSTTTNYNWGLASDIPVPGDYDGDSKTDYAVYRPATGTWYCTKSNGGAYLQVSWGNYGDQPVVADYDGDGITDIAVWRPKTGTWYVIRSSDGSFLIEALGVTGDVPTESAYLKQIGSSVQEYDFAKLRLSPKESTGGTDLYSRNFSWGTGLVGLPGRAGLDAGFGISYNSLVWIKYQNSMIFDPDYSNVAPGFRLGFPTIEPIYYDATTQKFSYLLVTPSGARVEFQQTAASNTYETVDSSYVQLKTNTNSNPNDPYEDITITVTGTDGTQAEYKYIAGAYRCKQIKDRNGNYITISHNTTYGLLESVTDTLGRVIHISYDSEQSPTSITQNWQTNNGQGSVTPHTYATFVYKTETVTPSFSGSLGVFGPQGAGVKVLEKIIYGTAGTGNNTGETRFEYNTFGQVEKVTNYANDGTKLNHTATNLNTPGTNKTDVPRMEETRSWVKNFNIVSGTEQEVVFKNDLTENKTYTLPNHTGQATLIEVLLLNPPSGITVPISKTYVGDSGWKEGLTLATETCLTTTCTGTDRKRWTWNEWKQDDENLSYIQNPRITKTKVGDDVSTRRTEIDYWLIGSTNVSEYGLTKEIRLYDDSNNKLWKKTITSYNLGNDYVSKRIIGLPQNTKNYGYNQKTTQLELVAETDFIYDGEDFTKETNQNITPIQHDSAYSTSFIIGRGNLTSTTRKEVGTSNSVVTKVRYDIAGSPVASIDPLGKKIKLDYSDDFNDGGNNRNAFAYPTTLTDPNQKSSTVEYRFDIGTNTWANSPAPTGNTNGLKTTRTFDSLGRLERQSVWKGTQEYSYTRYVYPNTGIESKVYSTVTDTNSNGYGDTADEVLTESWTDGAGRVLKSRTAHPGSSTGFSGSLVEYDILGRVIRSTVPTEINSSWSPAGDDSAWLWNSQEYDWKSRVTRKINTDGTDQLISYDGCGCAGGQITTYQDVLVPVPNQSTSARRTQKFYQDILGRTYKTEILNWDGTVYSTEKLLLNGRDQTVEKNQYQGTDTSSTFQTYTSTYDGYGRLKTSHRPEQQDSNGNPAFTTYNYNTDDSISSVTDARGVIKSFGYNNNGQVELIQFTEPQGSNISHVSDISFDYDDLGNRISMEDGLGTVDYEYNELSQLVAETRDFNDYLPNAPTANNGNYRIEYTYQLSGQLKSLKDPFQNLSDYSFDVTGRLSGVNTSGYGDLPQGSVVSDMKYRAFDSLKEAVYSNGTKSVIQYNNRLQPSTYRLTNTANNQILFGKDYFYTTGSNNDNDGLMKRSVHYDDTVSSTERGKHTRTNTYDFQGRIKTSDAGTYGGTPFGNMTDGAFQQTHTYNAFGNLGQTVDRDFEKYITGCAGCPRFTVYSETITNNRATSANYIVDGTSIYIPTFEYDNDGRLTKRDTETFQYDSAGQRISADFSGTTSDPSYVYNGDGKLVKFSENGTLKNYYITSSVLDATISELTATGAMDRSYIVSPEGARIASMENNEVKFINNDPSGSHQKSLKMDKTSAGVAQYDSTGRATSYTGYNGGGGPCGFNCPPAYNPPGGFDSLSVLRSRISQQRWQDKLFWNLKDFIDAGIIVGPNVPDGWDPNDNQDYRKNVLLPGTKVIQGIEVQPAPFVKDGFQYLLQFVGAQDSRQEAIDQAVQDVREILSKDNDCTDFFGLAIPDFTSSDGEGKHGPNDRHAKNVIPILNILGGKLTPGFLPNDTNNTRTIIRMSSPKTESPHDYLPNKRTNTPASRQFHTAIVNHRGAFFNNMRIEGYSSTSRAGRALAILHELAHLIRTGEDIRSPLLIPDDKDEKVIGNKSTKLIKEKCKKELDALNESN